MTATVPAAGHHRAAAQAEQIARMFAEGHDLTTVAQQGAVNGWTRMRAMEVVSQRGWTLNSSGRVPRHQRPAVTPGKPLPSVPAGMPGVGTIGGERPVVAEPAPSPGRAQVTRMLGADVTETNTQPANALDPRPAPIPRPASPEPKPAAKAAARAATLNGPTGPLATEVVASTATSAPGLRLLNHMATAAQDRERGSADALLTRAATYRHPDVTAAARTAWETLEKLRAAIEQADAAESARLALQARVGELDAETARLRSRLAELDVERAALLTKLPADTPPPAAPATAPHGEPAPAGPTPPTKATMDAGDIDHGTWGGFLKHRYRGETAEQIQAGCPDCYATKAGRGRKATR